MADDQNQLEQMSEEELRRQYIRLLNAIEEAGRHMFNQADDPHEHQLLFNEARLLLKNMTASHIARAPNRINRPPLHITPESRWVKCSDGSWALDPPGCLNPSLPKALDED